MPHDIANSAMSSFIDKGAMNSSANWIMYVKIEGKYAQVPPIPNAWWISLPRWEFFTKLPTAVRDGAVTLKGSHKMGEMVGFFYKNLRASLFNEGLLN